MSLLLNICKYNNCGLVFANLTQLIQHIEGEHINFNGEYMEKLESAKPAALPLSYVLPSNVEHIEFGDSDEEQERPSSSALTDSEHQNLAAVPLSDEISNLSEPGDVNFEDEIDPHDTFTFDFIMRYGSKRSLNQLDEKPFICPMPDCTKRYKNVNGLRYHARNGHKRNIKPTKKYECYCGRGYKTSQGLRAHAMALHNIALILPSSSSLPQTEDTLSLLALANMPNNAFEQMHDLSGAGNTHDLRTEPLSIEGVADEFDYTLGLTGDTCLNISVDNKYVKEDSVLNLKCTAVDRELESVSDLKRVKLERDEDSSTSSSLIWQETSDVDEKTNRTAASHVKSEALDDDEIDVGDANDTAYPYYHSV